MSAGSPGSESERSQQTGAVAPFSSVFTPSTCAMKRVNA